MIELTQIQKLIGIGKLPRLIHAPTDQKYTNSQISWETAAICCQVFKDHATAPVIATCLFHSMIHDDDVMNNVLGYNPINSLNELEKLIVQYCAIHAELHELDFELRKGNLFVAPALNDAKNLMDKLNNAIAEISEKANKKAKTTAKKKTLNVVH